MRQVGPLEHRAEIGPGHGEAQRREEGEGRPRERALERRGARRVADRAVGHGVSARVHRSRSAQPDTAVTGAAGVLHRRQQSGLEHLDDRRGRTSGDRRRGLGRRKLRHRDEAHAVAGGEEGRLRAEGVEEAQRRPPDDLPSAGGGDGIDAGLPPRDGHRSRRDANAWRGVARGLEGFGQEPEVGEPGREAEHERGVRPARVQPDEVSSRTGRARARARRGRARPLRRTPPSPRGAGRGRARPHRARRGRRGRSPGQRTGPRAGRTGRAGSDGWAPPRESPRTGRGRGRGRGRGHARSSPETARLPARR